MKDAGKYDSYSDGGLPNGPRQEPAPPRATTESERRDQLYKVWLNYNQLTGSVESRKVFDSACAILAPQGAPVAPVVEQALTRAAVLTMAWDVFNNKLHPVKMANDIAAALAQSTPHVPAGEQKRRRCNWCNELEPAASVAPVVEQAALDENRINALVMQVAYDKWSDKPTPSDYVKAGWSAALAQSTPHVPAGEPKQDRLTDRYGRVVPSTAYPRTPRASEPAAPVAQEPVAWRDPTNAHPGQGCTYDKATHEKWPHIYKQPLYAAPTAAQGLSDADMFWNDADPERGHDSIFEVLDAEFGDGVLSIGDTRVIQCAIRLPNITVQVVADPEDDDSFDYEILSASRAAQETK